MKTSNHLPIHTADPQAAAADLQKFFDHLSPTQLKQLRPQLETFQSHRPRLFISDKELAMVKGHPDADYALALRDHRRTAFKLYHKTQHRPLYFLRSYKLLHRIQHLQKQHAKNTGWIIDPISAGPGLLFARNYRVDDSRS